MMANAAFLRYSNKISMKFTPTRKANGDTRSLLGMFDDRGTGSSTNLLLRGQRICWNRRRRRRAFAISGIAWGTPATGCTRTFGTDHYESISEDENGGPFVGRLICDKIVGGLTTGWKLRKDASRTREVWSRGTNCHGKKKTDERGEEKEARAWGQRDVDGPIRS